VRAGVVTRIRSIRQTSSSSIRSSRTSTQGLGRRLVSMIAAG
jgi:hypothetical protein